jgi:bifunctional non-homologous end joining protein LigD
VALLSPMLAEKKEFAPFDSPEYLYELKYDDWRMLSDADHGRVELRTKNGGDCTNWFPEVAAALKAIKGGPHVFDGEACVLDDLGRSDFDRFQDRARRRRWYAGCDAYCVFSLLVENGRSVMGLPLPWLGLMRGNGASCVRL